MSEYEITYSIKRDGVEIGFGAACWSDLAGALYAVSADIQNRQWETEPGMPDPDQIDTEAAR